MIKIQQLTMPIFLAPMAGGFNTPELVAAVANAGGVGSFGFAYSSPEAIDHALGTTAALTNGPINANFFVFPEVSAPQPERLEAALQAVNALSVDKHWDESTLTPPFVSDLSRQLEPVWQQRPAILTFHFGIPPMVFILPQPVLPKRRRSKSLARILSSRKGGRLAVIVADSKKHQSMKN